MTKRIVRDMSISGRKADLGTHSLHYIDTGSGSTVLLLHGGFQDHQSWGNQVDELARHFRVIAPDTRGHGRSGGGDLPASYSEFGRDAIALLDHLGIERTSVVGFSDGGCSALAMTLNAPERLSRVVLIGTPYHRNNYHPGILDRFSSMSVEDFENAANPTLSEVLGMMKVHMSNEAWLVYWNRIMKGLWISEPAFDLGAFAKFPNPVLILHGADEKYFPLQCSIELKGAFSDAELVVVKGAGHAVAQEAPSTANDLIVRFLRVGLKTNAH